MLGSWVLATRQCPHVPAVTMCIPDAVRRGSDVLAVRSSDHAACCWKLLGPATFDASPGGRRSKPMIASRGELACVGCGARRVRGPRDGWHRPARGTIGEKCVRQTSGRLCGHIARASEMPRGRVHHVGHRVHDWLVPTPVIAGVTGLPPSGFSGTSPTRQPGLFEDAAASRPRHCLDGPLQQLAASRSSTLHCRVVPGGRILAADLLDGPGRAHCRPTVGPHGHGAAAADHAAGQSLACTVRMHSSPQQVAVRWMPGFAPYRL